MVKRLDASASSQAGNRITIIYSMGNGLMTIHTAPFTALHQTGKGKALPTAALNGAPDNANASEQIPTQTTRP